MWHARGLVGAGLRLRAWTHTPLGQEHHSVHAQLLQLLENPRRGRGNAAHPSQRGQYPAPLEHECHNEADAPEVQCLAGVCGGGGGKDHMEGVFPWARCHCDTPRLPTVHPRTKYATVFGDLRMFPISPASTMPIPITMCRGLERTSRRRTSRLTLRMMQPRANNS
jgi:hypothetical protein